MINILEIAREVEMKMRIIFPGTVVKVMIYGSFANGSYDDESDLDLIVLVTNSDGYIESQREKISNIVAEVSSLYNIFVSVIVRNEFTFNERSTYVPFYMNVARYGVEIHG